MTDLVTTVHDGLYRLLHDECKTAENFIAYCNQRKLKNDDARRLGFVSHQDLLNLLLGKLPGGVRADNRLYRAYDSLVEADVLTKISLGGRQLYDYQINFGMVSILSDLNCLDNIIKGPVFTVTKYAMSTVAVVIEKRGTEAAGTGSLVLEGGKSFVLTNKHILDPAEGCKLRHIFLGGDPEKKIEITSLPKISDTDDLALLTVELNKLPKGLPFFRVSPGISILEKVTTLAYPSIPRTNNYYLTAHSGELNARIQTRDGEFLNLISSFAAPGSSGGPVLDFRGLISAIVTQRLEGNYEGGFFGHTAAVPHDRLMTFIHKETSTGNG
jgi:S1-C subfamily serine protease